MSDSNLDPAEIQELILSWMNFVRDEKWQILMKLAEEQIASRKNNLRLPVKLEGIFEQEFAKGEMAGISLFCELPEIIITNLKASLENNEC